MAVAGSLAILMSGTVAHADEPLTASGRTEARALQPLAAVPTTAPAQVAAAATPTTYTVRRGDTVSAIAARHGLRTVDVLAINGLSWSSTIYPGQVLRLSGAAPAAPAAPATPAAPPAAAGTHAVAKGDTISAIARKYGVSIQAIFQANGLGWSSIIYPGQKIAIPGAASTAPTAPPATAPPAAAPPAVAPTAGTTYTVRGGDTISAIAARHGVTTQAVLDANRLGRSSIIYPGQKITIPGAFAPVSQTAPAAPAASSTLDAEQIANAQIIIRVGRELGVSDRGIAIALGTAMQESWLRNLDWGDRDSLGLFQQRPSTGWGTPAEVRDAVRSTRAFYGGPSDPNGHRTRGLLDIAGWQNMSFAQAAQAVQISAYPDRYARWEQPAYAWLAAHG